MSFDSIKDQLFLVFGILIHMYSFIRCTFAWPSSTVSILWAMNENLGALQKIKIKDFGIKLTKKTHLQSLEITNRFLIFLQELRRHHHDGVLQVFVELAQTNTATSIFLFKAYFQGTFSRIITEQNSSDLFWKCRFSHSLIIRVLIKIHNFHCSVPVS